MSQKQSPACRRLAATRSGAFCFPNHVHPPAHTERRCFHTTPRRARIRHPSTARRIQRRTNRQIGRKHRAIRVAWLDRKRSACHLDRAPARRRHSLQSARRAGLAGAAHTSRQTPRRQGHLQPARFRSIDCTSRLIGKTVQRRDCGRNDPHFANHGSRANFNLRRPAPPRRLARRHSRADPQAIRATHRDAQRLSAIRPNTALVHAAESPPAARAIADRARRDPHRRRRRDGDRAAFPFR